MNTVYVYPGTFSPPTYGHLRIVERAAELFPEVYVLCSENPDKNSVWFSPTEVKKLWGAYKLSGNVKVETLAEFLKRRVPPEKLVMIRGVRDESDFDYEKGVFLFNRERFGIDKYFYFASEKEFGGVSSSAARTAAEKLDLSSLSRLVAPLVVSALLERVLKIKNIWLVVGLPGSGKSTMLKRLSELDRKNRHINTDEFNHALRPYLKKIFGEEDLFSLALKNEEKLQAAIKDKWLKMLISALKKAEGKNNVFVEAAYGLKTDKRLYRFVGGKVLFVGCPSISENFCRLSNRGTPHLSPFLKSIPGWEKSVKIAKRENLRLVRIESGKTLEELESNVQKFSKKSNLEDL